MKISEDQLQNTIDGTHIDGITLNCGANIKKQQQSKKPHQNIKSEISSLSKFGRWGGIKIFRRLNATKSLNSLSAKGHTLRNKFYLLCLYFTSYLFFGGGEEAMLCDNNHVKSLMFQVS